MEIQCEHCNGGYTEHDCDFCKNTRVAYQIMIVETPDGETFLLGGHDTNEAIQSFGDTLEVKHVIAYPKDW